MFHRFSPDVLQHGSATRRSRLSDLSPGMLLDEVDACDGRLSDDTIRAALQHEHSDELIGTMLGVTELRLADACQELELGFRTSAQRDVFDERIAEYGGALGLMCRHVYDGLPDEEVMRAQRDTIIDSVQRVLHQERCDRLQVSRYEQSKAWLAATKTRRFVGRVAVGATAGASVFEFAQRLTESDVSASAAGAVFGIFALRGIAPAVARSVVKSAARTVSKSVSNAGAAYSNDVLAEHAPTDAADALTEGQLQYMNILDDTLTRYGFEHPTATPDESLDEMVDMTIDHLAGRFSKQSIGEWRRARIAIKQAL